MAVGDNGILSRAKNAKEETDLSKEKEILELSISSAYTEESLYRELTLESLKNSLDSNFGNNETTLTENPDKTFTIKIKKSGNEYQLTKTGKKINVNKVKDKSPAELAGSGTEVEPYLIESIEDLIFFSYQVREGIENYEGKYIELTTDLNFASSNSYVNPNSNYSQYGYDGNIKNSIDKNGFIPIGELSSSGTDSQKVFKGTFDGKYHNVINLNIGQNLQLSKNENGNIGFFSSNLGIIKNLKLILNCDVSIQCEEWASVGIVSAVNQGTIQNCSVNGLITYTADSKGINLGGLVGDNYGGIIENCFSNMKLTLNVINAKWLRVGGICGTLDKITTVKNCYNTGNITVSIDNGELLQNYIGGVIGTVYSDAIIENIYNLGKISEITSLDKGLILDSCIAYYMPDKNYKNKAYSLNDLVSTENPSSIIKNNFTLKTKNELQGSAGVTLLNQDNDNPIWIEDTIEINNGYPIFKWQTENN